MSEKLKQLKEELEKTTQSAKDLIGENHWSEIDVFDRLEQMPNAIAQVRLDLEKVSVEIWALEAVLAELKYEIEKEIAYNYELRNDLQRNVRRHELQQSEKYQAALIELRQAQYEKAELEVVIELLRNQFEASKLVVRREISKLEGLNSCE